MKSQIRLKRPSAHTYKTFFACGSFAPETWAWRWRSCLACRDPGGTKCTGVWTASATGVKALTESFLEPLLAGDQKIYLAIFSVAPPIQALRWLPCLGSFSVVPRVRHREDPSWLESSSVDGISVNWRGIRWHIRELKGHSWWGPPL